MASADLRDEVTCSVCLSVYRDPVTLRCGHNFCRVCIDRVLDTQEGTGEYSCPDCREEFQERPVLIRNITLRNIAERFLSTRPEQEETGIFCSYCEFPVPATKTCLQCETSMCGRHLRIHNKSVDHVLISPTTNLEIRKCSVHKKILEYYCTEDSACICVSCSLAGDHRGHQVETLDEAFEKKKEKLRNVLEKLTSKREETERRVQSLEERRREIQGTAAAERERVTALIRDIRRQLEDLEKRVLSEISRQEERMSLSDLIRQLEIKKDEMSRKMSHIEELCNMTDPLTVLQESDTGDLCDIEELCNMTDPLTVLQESDTGDLCDIEELCNMTDPLTVLQESDTGDLCDTEEGDNKDRERHDTKPDVVEDLDVGLISNNVHTLSDIITGVKRGIYIQKPTDILLDVNTAPNHVHISDDLKTASGSQINQNRPETPERFQDYQVLSTRSFSSGRHYWEVETNKSKYWRVGVCYPSIERRGRQSPIGNNRKSWGLYRCNNRYRVTHDSKDIQLPHNISCNRFRISLDYEGGRLSFYELSDPIRHLDTFTATFTEPLHAAFYVGGDGSIKISG